MGKFKVAICAGHGGNNSTPGKRDPDGIYEWNYNDKVARAFMAEMNKYENVEVRRFDDASGKTDTPLSTRTNGANAWDADIYISFHHNANTSKWGNWTGTETFVYPNPGAKSLRLASLVHAEILKAYGLQDRGVKKANFHIVRETKMPAILVEGGFMDSIIDIKKLRNDSVLANAGKATATGVASYGGLKKKTVTAPKPSLSVPNTSTAGSYKVVKGDTLWGISRKTGVSVNDLKSSNGLKSDLITPGQVLYLGKATVHTVVKGDTLWGISKKYSVTVDSIKSKNSLTSDVIHAGDKLIIK